MSEQHFIRFVSFDGLGLVEPCEPGFAESVAMIDRAYFKPSEAFVGSEGDRVPEEVSRYWECDASQARRYVYAHTDRSTFGRVEHVYREAISER